MTEEVEKLEIQRNSCVIAHVGSNDLYLRGGRVGNSEPIVKDMKRLVNKVLEKTNKGIVVGMLPRSYVSHFALSKAIAINERMKKYRDQKKVEFIDLWGMFVGKRHLFRKDGIHLSEAGQRKFGEILNKECEKVMRSDRIGTRESSEVSPVPISQGIEENENLEYSFFGLHTGKLKKTRRVNDNVEKSLRALVFNAQSIRNKMDLFRALLATEKPEIVGITETWIHTNTRDFEGEFEIPGYKTFKKID